MSPDAVSADDRVVRYADRRDAGRRLAASMPHFAGTDAVVLGLPRGGVPVAVEVARALGAPLDVLVVRKLGAPGQPELAAGAVGEGGVVVINDAVARAVPADRLVDLEQAERAEVDRRARLFRSGRSRLPLTGRTAIIVDDGIATGASVRAACQIARATGATTIVVAVPVGPPGVASQLRPDADDVVCLATPSDFRAVGRHYADFTQTTDDEVVALLASGGPPPAR